jgi:hypothetical protein
MPKAWWPKWAEFQRIAAKTVVETYGPDAPGKVRFQLFNEPYDRGEDATVDELMAYLVPRIVGRDGTVHGCPLDGPSLWGPPTQLNGQIDRFARFLKMNPDVNGVVRKVPMSMYPSSDERGLRDSDELVRQYVSKAVATVKLGEKILGRPVYFSEVGVGRVYDVIPKLFGARTNELAEKALFASLHGFRANGLQHVTIYQTKDHDGSDAEVYGYGLADRQGRLRVDLSSLARLSRGEPLAVR